MRVSGIIHQQICQLKWHLLACLGLIMVLPIEEAVVNLKAGDGFFSTNMTFPAIMFGPLLAGLIACANVQGDLNEKRYIFWRSKPANVKLLISLKFFIGLISSLIILACPVVFAFLSNIIWNKEGIDRMFFRFYVPLPILVAIMTYSLCFASNVLVRKTARAWLIGMLMGCLLLVLPFMLPLDYKDFVSDVIFLPFGFYLAIILVASAAAFVFALYAAQHDLHLRTNLKGLLWAGAGLAYVLLILFSSQVANIKVLREKEIGAAGWSELDYLGSRLMLRGRSYVDVSRNKISLSHVVADPNTGRACLAGGEGSYGREGYIAQVYPNPRYGGLYKKVGNDVYSLAIYAYFRRQEKSRFYEKIYLRSYTFTRESQKPVCELDISDCLTDVKNMLRMAMRLIDNRLIACVNDSCIVVDATNPRELKLIDKKLDVLKKYRPYTYKDRQEEFAIPLVPIEEIGLEERIRLSIDLNYQFYYGRSDIFESSIVDIHDGKFSFFFVDYDDIARFDVTRWDDEKVYCRFSTARPFTILESMTKSLHYSYGTFVKNGKLYSYNKGTLMVFDIRSNRRIRKMGHFVRTNYEIEDVGVLDDGKILLCVRWDQNLGRKRRYTRKGYLYLLENPE